MTWNLSEKKQIIRWVVASAIGLCILFVTGWFSREVYPTGDPLGFLRQMFDIGGPVILRSTAAVGILLYVSLIENGDWLDKIGETPYGPTILLSTLLYAVLRG